MRRGDLSFSAPERLIPNSYYVNLSNNIAEVLYRLGFEPEFELHTEVSESKVEIPQDSKSWAVTPPYESVTVDPADDALADFEQLPNLIKCYNEPAIVTMQKLATADILIMSKSSFSYVAAILNPRGVVMYHDFWHKPASSWINTTLEGKFNEDRFTSTFTTCRGGLYPLPRPVPPTVGLNVALGKPTSQSSVSGYISHPSNDRGNNGIISGLFGFHTDWEANPWWQIDLEREHPIHEIRIFNRMDSCSDRSRTLEIFASNNGADWVLIHDQGGKRFGGIDGQPLQVFPTETSARFIKIQLKGVEFLHLDEVEIY